MAFYSEIIKLCGDHLLDYHRPSRVQGSYFSKYQTRHVRKRKFRSILQFYYLTSFLRINSNKKFLCREHFLGWAGLPLRSFPALEILNYTINMPWIYRTINNQSPVIPMGLKQELMCRILKHT